MLFDTRKTESAPQNPSQEAQSLAVERIDKKQRARQRRLLGVQASLLALTTVLGTYSLDVQANKERQASSEASVTVHDEPLHPENDSSALVFFNGFGTYDADSIADTFGPGLKETIDGESWSINYGNAPLNSQRLAEKIEALAQERGITTVDIVGYSAGGVIGIDTAAELSKNNDPTIRSITAVSTPDGIDGLRPHQRAELESADILANIPGAQYSTAVRLAGEVYFMRDRYTEGSLTERARNFGKTALFAHKNIQRPDFPGTWLLVDQALAIAESDIATNIETIQENYKDSKPYPSFLYIGTEAPGRDYMVNNERSSKNICRLAHTHAMSCSIYNTPGAIHTMPEKTADAYTETFTAAADSFRAAIVRAEEQAQVRLGLARTVARGDFPPGL